MPQTTTKCESDVPAANAVTAAVFNGHIAATAAIGKPLIGIACTQEAYTDRARSSIGRLRSVALTPTVTGSSGKRT
jgi:hypothetical protein